MIDAAGVLAINIPIGEHVTRKVGGVTFNIDTIWQTVVAGVIVVGTGLYLRHRATSGTPGKLQLFWEFVVGSTNDQVENSLGPGYGKVVSLAVALFIYILVANWLELFPGLFHNTDYSPAPSADVNFTYGLGLLVFVLTNAESIRVKGFRRYVSYFFRKPVALAPLRFLEELVKPLTLALRLFGNLFSSAIMIALLISFPFAFFPASILTTVVWKLFAMFIGVIQAFIFALLTILYFQFAIEEEE
jgi:F-type H+-transporting ATPase subunit a